jgi:hypothetical protein
MDEEGILIDIADVRGRAEALTCIMAAMVASFVNKGLLAKDEAATLTSAAKTLLDNVKDFPDDARLLADSALRGFARSWTKLVTIN